VRGLSDRRVLHPEIAADGPDDDLPGVEADTNLDRDAEGALHLVAVPPDLLLHVERRVAGPHGVVLVGERRSEQRHDPVAQYLVDRPLVAVDRLHHALEDGVEEPTRVLGIAVDEELHQVGLRLIVEAETPDINGKVHEARVPVGAAAAMAACRIPERSRRGTSLARDRSQDGACDCRPPVMPRTPRWCQGRVTSGVHQLGYGVTMRGDGSGDARAERSRRGEGP
jgi:hypothetical protein